MNSRFFRSVPVLYARRLITTLSPHHTIIYISLCTHSQFYRIWSVQFKYISSGSQTQILSSYAFSPQAPHSTRVLLMGLHYGEGRCSSAPCLYAFIYSALKDEMREEGNGGFTLPAAPATRMCFKCVNVNIGTLMWRVYRVQTLPLGVIFIQYPGMCSGYKQLLLFINTVRTTSDNPAAHRGARTTWGCIQMPALWIYMSPSSFIMV